MRTEKVYEVEFMTYTNAMKNTVSDYTETQDIGTTKYIHVGFEPFLITESQIDYFSDFGGGFRSLKFVGNIPIPFDIDFGVERPIVNDWKTIADQLSDTVLHDEELENSIEGE